MNFLYDARWPEHTGIGVVMTELIKRVPSELCVSLLSVNGGVASPLAPFSISRSLSKIDIDNRGVFWNPGFVPPLSSLGFKTVVTVHDLTHLRFYSYFHKFYYNFILKSLYKNCSAVICVSDYTRKEFIDWSGVSEDSVFTIYNGVSNDYFLNDECADLGFSYIFYPGNHRDYKNLHRLVDAYASSMLPKEGVHFCLTGSENLSLLEHARNRGVDKFIHFLGRLPSKDLPKFYRGSLFVVFVSLYEGFGLPIVEAMASGVPVITSNVSSMPEVGGEAVYLVDPYSVDAIVNAMNDLLVDSELHSQLVRLGRERVKVFNWDISGARFWNLVNSLDA